MDGPGGGVVTGAAKGIFISYRRDDTAGQARALNDRLTEHFGTRQVFMDVESIAPGVDYMSFIQEAVTSCGVLLALIGREWVGPRPDGTRRIDDPGDFVALELSTALQTGVPVIPILLERVSMPLPASLPEALRPICRLNALEMDNTRWSFDLSRLLRAIESILHLDAVPPAAAAPVVPMAVAPAPAPAPSVYGYSPSPTGPAGPPLHWTPGTAPSSAATLPPRISPPPAPPRDLARDKRVWAAAAAVIIIAAVGIGFAATRGGSGTPTPVAATTATPSASATARPSASASPPAPSPSVSPPQPTPVPTLTLAEEDLRTRVPGAFSANCSSLQEQFKRADFQGVTSLSCTDVAKRFEVHYYALSNKALMDQEADRQVSAYSLPQKTCNPASNPSFLGAGTWTDDNNALSGRLLCYLDTGSPRIDWTDTNTNVYAVILPADTTSTVTPQELYTEWGTAAYKR